VVVVVDVVVDGGFDLNLDLNLVTTVDGAAMLTEMLALPGFGGHQVALV